MISPDATLANCKEILDSGKDQSGLYKVYLNDGKGEFTVFCDMHIKSGGWTVIQRRVDNSTSFDRTRREYNNGFGHYDGNFWLGLEKIKRLTDYDGQTFELYIGLESFLGGASHLGWSQYDTFSLNSDIDDYQLTVSGIVTGSTAGDGLGKHNGKKFSTPDEDNDPSSSHCADDHKAGWWYDDCHDSNLNGVYHWNGKHPGPGTPTFYDGIIWEQWVQDENSLKTVVMAVRPR